MLLEERATVDPPVGAAFDRVTVQAALEPEGTVVGEHCSPVTVTGGAEIVRVATAEVALREAVTVTARLAATEPAAAVKAAVEEPAAATTEAGTVKAALLEERATVEPPAGAA